MALLEVDAALRSCSFQLFSGAKSSRVVEHFKLELTRVESRPGRMRRLGRHAVTLVRSTRRRPLAIESLSSTRLDLSRTALTARSIAITIISTSSAASIVSTASFCSTATSRTAAGAASGADLTFFERKTLDARLFFLEGMLRDPTPNLSQMCETISDLSEKPYARAAMLRDDVCRKFTRSFIAVPEEAATAALVPGGPSAASELPSAEAYAAACYTLSALDVGSCRTSVVDEASGKEFFQNITGCAFLYSLVFRSSVYLSDPEALLAACNGLLLLTADDSPAGHGMRKWICEDFIASNVTKWANAASAAHPTGPAAEAVKQIAARFEELSRSARREK